MVTISREEAGVAHRIVGVGWGAVLTKDGRRLTPTLHAVTFAKERFVAVGEDGVVLTGNGEVWEGAQMGDSWWTCVTYNPHHDLFIAAAPRVLITSPDGGEWRAQGLPHASPHAIAFRGKTVVVAGGGGRVIVTDDLTRWEQCQVEGCPWFASLAYGNGFFVGVGEEGVAYLSTGGTDWWAQPLGKGVNFMGITFGRGRFVAVGSWGTVLWSRDGKRWYEADSGTTAHLQTVSFSEDLGLFIAGGSKGTLLTSPDGEVWTKVETNYPKAINGVAGGALREAFPTLEELLGLPR